MKTKANLPMRGAALVAILGLGGCDKKSGDAIVISKEHIAAAEPTATPTGTAAPSATPRSKKSPDNENDDETAISLPAGTIAVGIYIMRPEDRGTGRDPRAHSGEQWIVTVRMTYDRRLIDVHANQSQFEKVKEGDRVKVTYKLGKYTGTVWDAEIH